MSAITLICNNFASFIELEKKTIYNEAIKIIAPPEYESFWVGVKKTVKLELFTCPALSKNKYTFYIVPLEIKEKDELWVGIQNEIVYELGYHAWDKYKAELKNFIY